MALSGPEGMTLKQLVMTLHVSCGCPKGCQPTTKKGLLKTIYRLHKLRKKFGQLALWEPELSGIFKILASFLLFLNEMISNYIFYEKHETMFKYRNLKPVKIGKIIRKM